MTSHTVRAPHRRWALPAIAALTIVFNISARADDSFDWQDAANEVANLPFSSSYIDSIKKANDYSDPKRPLRSVKSGTFQNGETLVYEVSWGPFNAGYVILSAQPDTANKVIRLGGKALSNNFISAFYKMRDYVISTVDAEGLYPIFFEQHLREGKKYKADGWILYDHTAGKVYVQEKKFRTLKSPPFVHDYISVLYFVRTLQTAPGDTFSLNLFINSKVNSLFFKCLDLRRVQVDAGTFDCIRLESRISSDGGTINSKDPMEVWITNDENRIPILIKSKMKVGSVTAKLVWQDRSSSPAKPDSPPLQTHPVSSPSQAR